MIVAGALGWRMNIFPVHVDDTFDRTHQEALGLGVVLGDDHKRVALIFQGTRAGGHRQVENRNGRAANARHTAHHRVGLGDQGQLGALQHLADLEHIDPVKLWPIQTKQQQLQAVLPHQLSALVNRIHHSGHTQLLLKTSSFSPQVA